MRAIVLGSELISLATAYHLADIGYEVTVIETQTEINVKQHSAQTSLDQQLFRQQLENKLSTLGVNFRYACKNEKFIIQGKKIRGISFINEYQHIETLMAERFVAAFDQKEHTLLKSIGIRSASQFQPFCGEQTNHPLIGKSRYSNLFLNLSSNTISTMVASQMGKLLAEHIYNPVSGHEIEQQSSVQRAATSLFAYVSNVLGTLHRAFSM